MFVIVGLYLTCLPYKQHGCCLFSSINDQPEDVGPNSRKDEINSGDGKKYRQVLPFESGRGTADPELPFERPW